MQRITGLFVAVVGLAVALAVAPPAPGGAEAPPAREVIVAGSGSVLALGRRLAEMFRDVRPDIVVRVRPSIGSTGGIRAVAEGAISIGLASRPLRHDERDLGVTLTPFAVTPVVIAAHPAVPDDDLTSADLVAIYRGTKTRWRDGHEIVVLTREPGDSTIEVLSRSVPSFADAFGEAMRKRRWRVLFTDQAMNAALAGTGHAIGVTDGCTAAVERLPIKALRLDGVSPTAEHVTAGRYRLVKDLTFVARADRLSDDARAFVAFVRSPRGRAAITAAGCIPS